MTSHFCPGSRERKEKHCPAKGEEQKTKTGQKT